MALGFPGRLEIAIGDEVQKAPTEELRTVVSKYESKSRIVRFVECVVFGNDDPYRFKYLAAKMVLEQRGEYADNNC